MGPYNDSLGGELSMHMGGRITGNWSGLIWKMRIWEAER